MTTTIEITTCSESLINAGQCCACQKRATMAMLDDDFVEHARCDEHAWGITKPLMWDPIWAPEGRS